MDEWGSASVTEPCRAGAGDSSWTVVIHLLIRCSALPNRAPYRSTAVARSGRRLALSRSRRYGRAVRAPVHPHHARTAGSAPAIR